MSIEGLSSAVAGGPVANGIASGARMAPAAMSDVDAALAAARTGSPVEQGAALRALDRATGDARVAEAAVRGDTTLPASTEVCSVEVRYKPVVGPTNHAFIVTRDADSTNYFRGGPQANNAGLNSSSSRGDGQAPVDERFGIYGPIVTEYGAYRPGTVDWTTTPSGQQTVSTTPGNCDAIETRFARHMDDIEAAAVNYSPLGANSNSTVRETLERSGFPDVSPVVWSPAWHAQLPGPR